MYRPGRRRIGSSATAADAPNRLWVADITYVPTLVGFLYLAIVLDVFSRRVVGWAMATHLRTELVVESLEMAVEQRRPEAVVHHSDQGCQYTSLAFGGRCREWGVALSNAMAESFFATLECELLARTTLSTHAEARAAIFEFIEGWYNTRRRHSALSYASPLEFERLHAAVPVGGARPVEALQAPTSQVELGLPVTTHAVTGFAAGARVPLRNGAWLSWKHSEEMVANRYTARLRLREANRCCGTVYRIHGGAVEVPAPGDARSHRAESEGSARRAPPVRWKSRGRSSPITPVSGPRDSHTPTAVIVVDD